LVVGKNTMHHAVSLRQHGFLVSLYHVKSGVNLRQPIAQTHQYDFSSLLHSVKRILFTVLLVYLILRISPHHSHHLRSNHLSLPLHFTPVSE